MMKVLDHEFFFLSFSFVFYFLFGSRDNGGKFVISSMSFCYEHSRFGVVEVARESGE